MNIEVTIWIWLCDPRNKIKFTYIQDCDKSTLPSNIRTGGFEIVRIPETDSGERRASPQTQNYDAEMPAAFQILTQSDVLCPRMDNPKERIVLPHLCHPEIHNPISFQNCNLMNYKTLKRNNGEHSDDKWSDAYFNKPTKHFYERTVYFLLSKWWWKHFSRTAEYWEGGCHDFWPPKPLCFFQNIPDICAANFRLMCLGWCQNTSIMAVVPAQNILLVSNIEIFDKNYFFWQNSKFLYIPHSKKAEMFLWPGW